MSAKNPANVRRPNGEDNKAHALLAFGLSDYEVITPEGRCLGTLDDLLIEHDSGRIVCALLSSDDAEGRLLALPWKLLHVDPGHRCFVVDAGPGRAEEAPGLGRDEKPWTWSEAMYCSFLEDVLVHFGIWPPGANSSPSPA